MHQADDRPSQHQPESSQVAESVESSLQREMSHSLPHADRGKLPRSPTPTMKTESSSQTPSPDFPSTHQSHVQVALKILVSNSASGLIIGRSGKTISELQTRSQCRIKLSQGGDYYPGTSDRVCLVQGAQAHAMEAVEMVLAKLYELQSIQQLPSPPVTTGLESGETVSVPFIVRLLVPSTCCGMIIGHGGSNIKSLKEKSNVTYIQLSPKEHEVLVAGSVISTSERIMTITGSNFETCATCVKIIVNDMAQNPEISRYINMTTNYSKNLVNMMSPPPTSSYAAAPAPGYFMDEASYQQHVLLDSPRRYSVSDQLIQGPYALQPSSPSVGSISHGEFTIPPISLQGDTQQCSPEDFSSPPRNPVAMHPSSYPQYQQAHPQFWLPGSPTGGLATGAIDQLTQSFTTQASIERHNSHSSLPNLTNPNPVTLQFGVPDARIGSILGRGGKLLTELQKSTSTKIQLSQRGDYVPGTQNRVVTITGNTAEDVENAKHIIDQRLAASLPRLSSA